MVSYDIALQPIAMISFEKANGNSLTSNGVFAIAVMP